MEDENTADLLPDHYFACCGNKLSEGCECEDKPGTCNVNDESGGDKNEKEK